MENNFNELHDFVEKPDYGEKASDINPHNPFNNFTEYEHYNSDYSEVVPQIELPGCEIPFEPSYSEKKSIRHYFNIAGLGMFSHFLLTNGLMLLLTFIISHFVMNADNVSRSEVTIQYENQLNNFLNNSSVSIGLNMLIIMTINILIFLVGSKASKIKMESYFQTTDLTFGKIMSYFCISFFLRYVAGIAGTAFEYIFNGVDMTVGTEMLNYQGTKTIILTVIYTCLVAPITEELLCRGFLLKNLSRVGQRFGIFMSTLIFGLMHGNISQFIFAFFFGVFLAHIDIKHNSIIPSMIVHALANTFSIIISYSGILDNVIMTAITGLVVIALGIVGVILYCRFHKKDRLPYTMPHQKLRNGSAVSSVFLIVSISIYAIITILNSFPSITNFLN